MTTSKNLFSEESVISILKHNESLNQNKNWNYFLRLCSQNKKALVLSVPSERDGKTDFVLVKTKNSEHLETEKKKHVKTFGQTFTLHDINNKVYLGFKKQDFRLPFTNNLENLKTVLEALANFQVTTLVNSTNRKNLNNEYDTSNIVHAINSLDLGLDQVKFTEIMWKCKKSVDGLLENDILVKSVGRMAANNLYLRSSQGSCTFLDLGYKKFMSPVYDALIYIFALSDEEFRQHFLKELLSLYYHKFIKCLEDKDSGINFDIHMFEMHVNIFLPIVKLEAAVYLYKHKDDNQKQNHLKALLHNLSYSLKYPGLDYEDCLEAVTKKLGTTEFELLHYELVPLNQKYGQLGEYFFLKLKVKHLGKIKELSMFTKILGLLAPHLTALVQSGPSMKEDFFYRTFVPQLEKYGFQSLLDIAPKCYFHRIDEIVIMEDLAELGFTTFKQDSRIGYDELKLGVLNCAKLHALTFLLEDRLSKEKGETVKLGDIYGEFLQDWIFEERDDVPKSPVAPCDAKPGVDVFLDTFTDIPKKISIKEFHKRVDNLFAVFLERINHASRKYRNAICHGDFYASNYLVKYNKNNTAIQSFMVDFQGLRYAPPIQDTLLIIYASTNKNVRDKYLDKLLEEYFQELKRILTTFGLDINTVCTPTQFSECVNYMKPIMIIAALLYSHIMAVPVKEKEEIFYDNDKYKYYFLENRAEYVQYMMSISKDFTKYVRELVEDLYDVVCLD